MQVAKTEQVTEFLKYLITDLICAYKIDNDGFITIKSTDNKLTLGDPALPVILFKEKLPQNGVHILNPFAEGISESTATLWLYRSMSVNLSLRISAIIDTVIRLASKENSNTETKKKDASIKPLSPYLLNIMSKVINDVDEKMIDEISFITNKPDDLCYILYARKMLETRIQIPFIDDKEEPNIPKNVRKVTINVIKTIIQNIFNIETHSELIKFTAKAHPEVTPKIDSYLRCLFNIYEHINKIIDAVNPDIAIDLGAFKIHLDNMPLYSNNAKYMLSVSVPSPTSSVGVQTSLQSNVKTIPGGMRIDGTRNPPIPISSTLPNGNPGGLRPVGSRRFMGAGIGMGMNPSYPTNIMDPGQQSMLNTNNFGNTGYNNIPFTGNGTFGQHIGIPYSPTPFPTSLNPNFGSTLGMPTGIII